MKGLKDILNKIVKDDTTTDRGIENTATSNNNSKVKLLWKITVIAVLGAGVALGCCDLDCVLLHFSDFLGL